jgi:ferric-dicitrate binding protein FerR (iron transport regulator)
VHFGHARRSVQLDGEAYFDIAQASGAPFTVQTGGVSTRVLGTAFLMRHYDGERVVRVSVAAGKVSVTMHDRSAPSVLVAGDVGEVGDSTITFHAVRQLDADAEWIGGRLFFNDVPVQEVLATLTRWYGYQFQYSDSALASQNVTVWLSTRSSADALATLERLLNISATVTNDTVTLTPRHGVDRPRLQRKGSYDVWTPTREVGR